MTETTTLDPAVLAAFTGTETMHRDRFFNILFTDGVRYVADTAGAFWLIGEIALMQRFGPKLARRSGAEFQVWTLTRNKRGSGAKLACGDGNGNTLYTKKIPYTDFPSPVFTMWLCDGVIMLPSEY